MKTIPCDLRDKRVHRHTFGVFLLCWPCGVVVCFDELFGSEGKLQVYAIWMEWLAGLSAELRSEVTHFMYDDMCHLKVQ
jgi:hypothetical protein